MPGHGPSTPLHWKPCLLIKQHLANNRKEIVMEGKKGITTVKLVAGISVAVWILVTIEILGRFNIHQVWPAALVVLFFFLGHADTKNIPNIFVGAAVGLLMASALPVCVKFLVPTLGLKPAIYVMVGVMVFLIVALGDVAHIAFNDYNFAYFTIALIFPEQLTVHWLATLVFAGAFFLFAVLYSIKWIMQALAKAPAAETAGE